MVTMKLRTWFLAFLALVLATVLVFAWTWQALAHSWYDKSCCDVRDCEPIPPDQVTITPQGYITPDGQLIPFSEARVSADRDYHWCKYQKNSTAVIQPMNERACFYAPAMGG